ncbi:MAG: amino acid adenylation domain-containing protein [Saprospiraceae bacterium]
MQTKIKPIEIVHSAQSKGINLFVDEGRLAIKKEKGISVPSNLIQVIKDHKKELIEFLEQEIQVSLTAPAKSIPKLLESESYKISNAQQRLWLVCQLEERSIAYNIPSTIVLEELLDINSFKKAVQAVIARHEILRTIFKVDSTGEIRQFILSPAALDFCIDTKDYSGEEDAAAASRDFILKDSYLAFDLAKGPLIRASLLRLSEHKYVFYYNIHHIISDGWSVAILSRDVMNYYQAFASGITPNISPLKIQYKDYAAWQLEQWKSKSYEKHQRYWLNRLSGELPIIDLPSDKHRPKVKTYNGKCLRSYLSKDLTNQLNQFVKLNEGSLYLVLLSAINVLIYKYTNADDIIIGGPVAGRTHPDLEDQIGFYVNILAFRNKIYTSDNFLDFYHRVKVSVLEDFAHQAYPFDKLVEDLGLKYNQSRALLYDISWEFHGSNSSMSSKDLDPKVFEEIEDGGSTICKNDIEFHSTQLGDILSFELIFNVDVYDEMMIARLMHHFKSLLTNLLSTPQTALHEIEYLSQKERHQLLEVFNDTAVDYPQAQTVIDVFVARAQRTPNAKAIVFEETALSYQALDQRSNQLANCLLQKYNVKNGDFVGVHLERSEQYIVCLLGIMKAGAVYVPVDKAYPVARKKYILQDAAIQLLIVDQVQIEELDYYEGSVLSIDVELELEKYSLDLKDKVMVTPADFAYVIYTSGSTGNPKGALIAHQGLLNAILAQIAAHEIKANYHALQFTSFSFDFSISEIFNTLLSGSCLHIASEEFRNDPKLLERYIQDKQIDLAIVPPSYFQVMNNESLKHLKILITGGDSPNYEKVRSFLSYGGNYYNSYGPTETSMCVSIFKLTKNISFNAKTIPIGKPIANTQFLILSDNLQLLPIGLTGELCISGIQLAHGYINRPDLTAEKFIDHPFKPRERLYRTGDLARWLPDGNVEFMGRKDHQVKLRGFRIELGEIEAALNQIAVIKQSVVLAVKDEEGSKELVAYLVCKEAVDYKSIEQLLTQELPEYMVPKIYVMLDEIPLTHNDKIDRKALPKPDRNTFHTKEYVAPRNEQEKLLVSIWESVLKLDKVSVKDNFYDLGGNSMKAIQLMSFLKKNAYEFSVRDSFEYPILEDMAKVLKKDSTLASAKPPEMLTLKEEAVKYVAKPSSGLSENQKYFLRRPWALIQSPTIARATFSADHFEDKFRFFLSFYESLLVEFEEEETEGEVRQKSIPSDQLRIDLKLIRAFDPNALAEVEAEAEVFLKKPFNYFNQTALLRVFIVVDPNDSNKAFFKISLAHALVDIESFRKICENLAQAFEQPKIAERSASNFTFAASQKKFLEAVLGKTQRAWWLNYLQSISPTITQETTVAFVDYAVQEVFLTGTRFEAIKEKARQYNLPISALFLAAHQQFLSELSFGNSFLQQIAVNGQEEINEDFDLSNLIGVTTNFLPLQIITPSAASTSAYIYEVYEKYLTVRLYQKIPYEIIRKDLFEATALDLDQCFKGYFNFLLQDTKHLQPEILEGAVSVSTDRLPKQDGVALVCVLFETGIKLRLLCPMDLYEDTQQDVCLNSFVKNKIYSL